MTHIYEALRRADVERAAEDSLHLGSADRSETPKLADNPPVGIGLTVEDAVKRTWAPCLDAIPALQDRGEVVEQFRGLRSHLAQARHVASLKTILVSSGMSTEGKSFVVLNLAISLARSNSNRVVLIDGDLRRPSLHHYLGVANKPGLSEYLEGTAEQFEILQRNDTRDIGKTPLDGLANLAFIASGSPSDHSSELITDSRLESLVASLSLQFDWILIDSPPVLAVPDAVDIARVADGILLIAREAKTPYQVMQRAQAAFQQFRLLGVVLNAAKGSHLTKYRYSSYYLPVAQD
jgi:protein-tyrosine kinase